MAGSENESQESKQGLDEEAIGKIVNAAVTSHLKRMIPNAITESLKTIDWGGTLGTIVDEKLKSFQPATSSKDESGSEGAAGKTDPAIEKQLRTLSEKLEASERRAAKAEEERQQIETQRQRDAAVGAFRSAVQAKVKPELLDVFVDHYTTKRLSLDEKGNPLFTVRKAPYKGAPEEDTKLTLDEAIPLLLSSKEASPFLPAPGGQQVGGVVRAPHASSSQGSSDPAMRTMEALQKQGIDPSVLL